MRRAEDRLQAEVVSFLRAVLPDYLVFAIPNGGKRTKAEGGILKATGVLAGVPDIAVVGRGGQSHFIELKSPKGRPSPAQIAMWDRLDQMQVPWDLARSVDDVRLLLTGWRIKTREVATMSREKQ